MADKRKERDELLKKGIDIMLGHDVSLSESEKKVNNLFKSLKDKIVEEGFEKPHLFKCAKHFFEYKDEVKKTELFDLIKRMPKGAILHCHDTALLNDDYIITLTYLDNLYVRFDGDKVQFLFSETIPDSRSSSKWQLMSDVRYSSGNIKKFDADLKKYFSVIIDNPQEVYTDVNVVWNKFFDFFITTTPLFSYKPIWEKYFYDALNAVREDNVMYVEVRSVLPELYDLKGNKYDSVATAESYKRVLDQFMLDHPDFIGAKLIYAPLRKVGKDTVKEYIKIAREIKKRLPDFLAGFDLVGQEDLGEPYEAFFDELVEASKEFDLYLHAGETNWNGTSSDENLANAIALGTKRIGHGYALTKYPVLIDEVRKRDIAIEVNVISNAVLKLVDDVRNHSLAPFIAQNLPVVISPDDPGIWGAEPLSHDFYVAFVGVASKHADLKLLKKFALNSIKYSAIKDKSSVSQEFENRWKSYIDLIVKEYALH